MPSKWLFHPLVNICIPISQYIGRCSFLEKYALKYHQNTRCYIVIFETWKNEMREKKSSEKVSFKPDSLKTLKMVQLT